MQSTNPHTVSQLFRDYARKIHAKASLNDPNYLAICVMCGKIETWAEHHYPSFVTLLKESKTIQYNESDPRSRIIKRDRELMKEKVRKERGEDAMRRVPLQHENQAVPWQLYLFVIGATVFLFAVTGMIVLVALWYFYGEEWTWRELGAQVTQATQHIPQEL
jgi:farnesyl-diphosphate farnesyltransferase